MGRIGDEIILDESRNLRIVSIRQGQVTLLIMAGLTFTIVGVSVVYLQIPSEPNSALILDIVGGLLASLFSFFIAGLCFRLALKRGYLRVYGKAIQLPEKRLSRRLKFVEEVIPYEKIEAIYPNENQDLQYVTIQLVGFGIAKDGALRKLDKRDDMFSLGRFLKAIDGKTRIIRDQDLAVGHQRVGQSQEESYSRVSYSTMVQNHTPIPVGSRQINPRRKAILVFVAFLALLLTVLLLISVLTLSLSGFDIDSPSPLLLTMLAFTGILLVWGVLIASRSPKEIEIGEEFLYFGFDGKQKVIRWSDVCEMISFQSRLCPFEIRCGDGSWLVLSGVPHEILSQLQSHLRSYRMSYC